MGGCGECGRSWGIVSAAMYHLALVPAGEDRAAATANSAQILCWSVPVVCATPALGAG